MIKKNRKLIALLHALAQQRQRPDQSFYTALLLADAQKIVNQTNCSLQEVERVALQEEILPERYSRNQKSYTCADQLKLLNSHVAIIGLGGLGGTVTEILARLGVGKLTLVDGDSFDESNINRQLLSSPAKIGVKKALAAATRVAEINPAVDAQAISEFFTLINGEAILAGTHLAIDCLDNIATRFVLEKSCQKMAIPMVSAAIAGDSGQATTIFPKDPGLQVIYGAPEKAPLKGIETTLGTLPFAAVYMAAIECAEAAAILLGKQPELRNKLLLTEISSYSVELVELPAYSNNAPG